MSKWNQSASDKLTISIACARWQKSAESKDGAINGFIGFIFYKQFYSGKNTKNILYFCPL
jgi:hypothetical protein